MVFRLLALTISLVIGLVLLEVGLRVVGYSSPTFQTFQGVSRVYPTAGLASKTHYTYDGTTGFSLIPGIHDPYQKITTDENGFRITARPYDPGKESIIFVGDSTVFGWGVADEHSFPYLLSQTDALSEFNIINMGVPTYSLGHIAATIEHKVPHYRPRIVLVQILWPWKPFSEYSSENAWKEIDFDFYRKTIGEKKTLNIARTLKTRAMTPRVYLLARDCYYGIRYRREIRDNLSRPGVRDFDVSEEVEAQLARDHITELNRACAGLRAAGVRVVFYIHPYQYTVFHPDYQHLGGKGRSILMQELGALYPADHLVRNNDGDPLFIDGCHLTVRGHQVFRGYFEGILRMELAARVAARAE